ncbi:hypothetical protein AAG906_005913 [Vitis piasezkii]
MKSKMMVNDLLDLDDHILNCKACLFGKQNGKPFPKHNDMVYDVSLEARGCFDVYQRCNIVLNVDGSINKKKARLVMKERRRIQGLSSQEGSLWPETSPKSLVGILIISLYVDDPLVTGNQTSLMEKFKLEMMEFLDEILKKFKLDECKEIRTPIDQKEKLSKDDGTDKIDQAYFRSLIGCLMYFSTTRLDILNVVSILSRFIHCASEIHLKAAKRVIRCVKGTFDFGIKFMRSKEFELVGFSDSD